MRLVEADLPGVYVAEPEPVADERGLFARTFSRDDFEEWGLDPVVAQCSTSFNERAGTLRGMHYQAGAAEETKLVRCTRGSMFDVAVDMRPVSPTYLRWTGTTLTADNRRALYVPKGFAHGFLTLEDATEVLYQISAPYQPGTAQGVRWDDPAIGITWPHRPRMMSDRDATYPLLLDSSLTDTAG
jgi:dTDP-4-dehydrorhamnose 3,5-epimerase